MLSKPKFDEDEGPPDEGYCICCGVITVPKWQDIGIGPYEFWGDRGVDVDWQLVSPCCSSDMEELKYCEECGNVLFFEDIQENPLCSMCLVTGEASNAAEH